MGGELARRRGAEVPGRLVASAKSWLCHPGVDREAPILPWGAGEEDEGLPRISPVDASARYLAHVRRAWDEAFPADPLAGQDVVLTGAGLLRRGSRGEPHDARSREARGPRRAPAGRASGGVLRLPQRARRERGSARCSIARGRGARSGLRRGRWHDGSLADPGRRARGGRCGGRPHDRACRSRAASAARRGQHGSRARAPPGGAARAGGQARRRALRTARERVPRRQGGAARRRPARARPRHDPRPGRAPDRQHLRRSPTRTAAIWSARRSGSAWCSTASSPPRRATPGPRGRGAGSSPSACPTSATSR